MKIFKFGGASVKDASGVKNIANIVSLVPKGDLILVISAMGKITNALEDVLKRYLDQSNYIEDLEIIRKFHIEIAQELMPHNQSIVLDLNQIINGLIQWLDDNESTSYDYIYDQVIGKGEILSTKIVSAYFDEIGLNNQWLDARDYIKTDSTYREAIVQWDLTLENLKTLDPTQLYITQGFIGSNENQVSTTLGREGSDYTGAILAYGLDAESLTIWKDVPGVLNADPRHFKNTVKLNHISYEEAIELSYYGASVIHPKTLQPLQHKGIPLYVRSFIDPAGGGTVIKGGNALEPFTPCYIIKQHQNVLQISTKNFAFIDEKVIRDVFNKLATYQLKVNLMQISAISLSLCIEDKYNKLEEAIADFYSDFLIEIVQDCTLYTVRHYTDAYTEIIPDVSGALIQQIRKSTLQVVIKS